MSPFWGDLNARTSGLGTHLLAREQLEALAREPDLPSLAAALRRNGVIAPTASELVGPEELELAIRRWAAALLLILERWAGPRSEVLPLVFDDEDRRSLRALFRGAVQRIPADRRLAGLIPTPSLPESALEALAAAPTTAAVSALLTAWQHPAAAVVAAASAPAHPDLFALESALSHAAADEATRAAARSRSRVLRDAVRDAIDLDNARNAILLAKLGRDVVARDQFLAGGARISLADFCEACATGEPHIAAKRLAAALTGTPFASALIEHAGNPADLEVELLRRRLRSVMQQVRLEPLGPLALLWFALRLRAQLLDLQNIIWTVALGAPSHRLGDALATTAR